MPVTVAPAIAKRVTQWDEYSGRFEAVASVEVRARVSGFIDKLHFRDGQIVAVGDLLFTIDKRPFEIAVESAQAEVARNKAQVDLADLQVQRGALLIGSRTITDADYDQRKATLNIARAQLKTAEAAVRQAELNLEWADVRAPIAGRISDRKVDAGNLIQGGQQGATLLATIVTLIPSASCSISPRPTICATPGSISRARWPRRAIAIWQIRCASASPTSANGHAPARSTSSTTP